MLAKHAKRRRQRESLLAAPRCKINLACRRMGVYLMRRSINSLKIPPCIDHTSPMLPSDL